MHSKKKEEILIGRHIPLTKPLYLLGSIKKAVELYGINSFMVYLSSPRVSSSGSNLGNLKFEEFKKYVSEKSFNVSNIVVHSSYLVNLGNFEEQKKLYWSINFLKSEFNKAKELGLKTIVIHPGSSLKLNRNHSLLSVSKSLDEVLESVSDVKVCLETMSGSGSQLGKTFDEIRTIIKNSKFPDRIGVCLDTCHVYSSGYDIKNDLESVLKEFDEKIGLQKVWVVHVNDSMFEINSRKDRHANIGLGQIGLKALSLICHHSSLENSIKILETPMKDDFHKKEISQIKNYFTRE